MRGEGDRRGCDAAVGVHLESGDLEGIGEESVDTFDDVRGESAGVRGGDRGDQRDADIREFNTGRFSLPSRRDLLRDWDDVIVSVANYFKAHGWSAGLPVLLEARSDADTFAKLDFRNLELNESLGALRARGVGFTSELPDATPAMLLPAELESGPNVRIGLANFKVITQYNRSIRYAMAVHDLAADITRRTVAGS